MKRSKESLGRGSLLHSAGDVISAAPSAFDFDQEDLMQDRNRMETAIGKMVQSLINIPIEFGSAKESERFDNLQVKLDATGNLREEANKVLAIADYQGGITIRDHVLGNIIMIGCNIVSVETVKSIGAILKKNGRPTLADQFTKLGTFNYSRDLLLKIDGVSLWDFFSFNPKKDSPVPYYQFMINSLLIPQDKSYETYALQNTEYPYSEYPYLTRHALSTIGTRVSGLIALSSNKNLQNIAHNFPNRLGKEIIFKVATLGEKVSQVQDSVFDILVNPQSKYALHLRNVITKFLSRESIPLSVYTLHCLGFGNWIKLQKAYREAKRFETNGIEVEFYSLLLREIEVLTQEGADMYPFFSKEDLLDAVGETDKSKQKATPTYEDFGKVLSEIASYSSQRKFAVKADEFDWDGLAVPKAANVAIDEKNPRSVKISLTFEGETGEGFLLDYTVDARKKTTDWNTLEDPTESKDMDITAASGVIRRIMFKVLERVAKDTEQKKKAEVLDKKSTSVAVGQAAKTPREHVVDPVYQLRKEVKQEHREESQPEETVSTERIIRERKVKNVIILPSEEEYRRKARALDIKDQAVVWEAIGEYNQQATGGQFAGKRKTGADGSRRYTLRVGNKRVLLKESISSDGVRYFDIVDIRYRKDIYPKNAL